MFVIVVTLSITLLTPTKEISPYYNTMKEASLLAKEAMEAVKEYKLNNNIVITWRIRLLE